MYVFRPWPAAYWTDEHEKCQKQVVHITSLTFLSTFLEINLLDDFDINESMDNIAEVQGLPYEGRAFEFNDVKQNLMKKSELPSEIAKQAKVYQGFTVTANVKVENNQECALLWIETIYSEYWIQH